MDKFVKPLAAFRVATVFPGPFMVTVPVPAVKVVLAPDVSQSPETVHGPVVIVVEPVPDSVNPSLSVTVDVLASNVPLTTSEKTDKLNPEVVRLPLTVVTPDVTALSCEMVPETTRP